MGIKSPNLRFAAPQPSAQRRDRAADQLSNTGNPSTDLQVHNTLPITDVTSA
jgi:hypothetical protein